MNQNLAIADKPTVPEETSNVNLYFDRVVVINLKRRPERLERFRKNFSEHGWQFRNPELFSAIDGNIVPCPTGFEQGGGAWGCLQSHRQILEQALHDDIDKLLVLEDDAFLKPDSAERLEKFIREVPDDWDQLMLGGQHIGTTFPVSEGIVRATNCQRTHAYAIRGQFLRDLYSAWCSPNIRVHCDWVMGPLQCARKVYCPDPFILGQEAGQSDISGTNNPRKVWSSSSISVKPYVVLLHAPKKVMVDLRSNSGWWGGAWRDPISDIDMGLRDIFETDGDIVSRLAKWIELVGKEVQDGVLVIHHKEATVELIQQATSRRVIFIKANTAEEALQQLENER